MFHPLHAAPRWLLALTLLLTAARVTDAGVVQRLDGEGWLLATDARNEGVAQRWSERPAASGAAKVRVPSVIQEVPGLSRRRLVLARSSRPAQARRRPAADPSIPSGRLPRRGLVERRAR